jgi:hypothetical protein
MNEVDARNGFSLDWLDCAQRRREAMTNEYKVIRNIVLLTENTST